LWWADRVEVSKMPAAIFITLNIMDAYLTKMSLAVGAVEANPLLTYTGSSIVIKGLVAIALAFILYCFKKERVLWPLNFMLFGLVLWNLAIYWIATLLGPTVS
jgi:hypothetical protein